MIIVLSYFITMVVIGIIYEWYLERYMWEDLACLIHDEDNCTCHIRTCPTLIDDDSDYVPMKLSQDVIDDILEEYNDFVPIKDLMN
jgi:hypothetical protein